MNHFITAAVAVLALLHAGCATRAVANDFYAGKQITFIVGSGVGGGYDLLARLAARHIGRLVPGHPTVIVQNLPAAGSLVATNQIYNTAPKDGTVVAFTARQADQSLGRALRAREAQLARQPRPRDRARARLAYRAAPHRQRPVRAGADRRRASRRRSGNHAAAL